MSTIPSFFISVTKLAPSIQLKMDYATTENFTGEIVRGYKAKKAYLALSAAKALKLAQDQALKQGLCLKIFDAYRPVKAVTFFQEWAKREENNLAVKERFYPTLTRHEIIQGGYIALRSSHSRGCAVDLTLVQLHDGSDLDMGSGFDFFDDLSHTESPKATTEQLRNRMKLKQIMEGAGFKNFYQEWWHYSFKPEPHPDEYFDFDVE